MEPSPDDGRLRAGGRASRQHGSSAGVRGRILTEPDSRASLPTRASIAPHMGDQRQLRDDAVLLADKQAEALGARTESVLPPRPHRLVRRRPQRRRPDVFDPAAQCHRTPKAHVLELACCATKAKALAGGEGQRRPLALDHPLPQVRLPPSPRKLRCSSASNTAARSPDSCRTSTASTAMSPGSRASF